MNKDIIESFKTYLITEKYLVDNSVESYYLDIKCYLEYLDKDYKNITREDIKDYLKYLNNSNYSKASTDRKISSIKTFHHYLYRYYSIEDISKNIERSKKRAKDKAKKIVVMEKDTNNVLDIFESALELERLSLGRFGVLFKKENVRYCCNNKSKRCYGYKVRYYEDVFDTVATTE